MDGKLIKSSIWLILMSLAIFIYSTVIFAGVTGKIAGTVKDAKTGEPLPGVNVVVVGTSMGAATDAHGHYFVIGIPPGTYSVRASMIGYEITTKTQVMVTADRTTPLDFALRPTVIQGASVTVVAKRRIIPMDVSSSQVVSTNKEILQVPLTQNISKFVGLQGGVQGMNIRGGTVDQTAFMVDGLMLVDNVANKPIMMVNLSSVKEVNIVKGGFNAEYGNIRSGLINVVTKEGNPKTYNGSINFRISPPHLKHSGPSLFNKNNFYLRPYLDPAVCWVGTKNGSWSKEMQQQYPEFVGWNAISQKLLSDDDPTNDRTPQESRDLFLWQHRAEGSGALGQKEGKYGNKPDWLVDASFGGPIPIIGKYLGNTSFFGSYRNNWEMFGLPTSRDYYKENSSILKITSHISSSMKLQIEGMYGEIHSVSRYVEGPLSLAGYLTSGSDIFWSPLATSSAYHHRGGANLYWPSSLNPFDVYNSMQGISLKHVLSPSTFYDIRISHIRVKYSNLGVDRWRNRKTIRYFGKTPIDETPYGFDILDKYSMQDGMLKASIGAFCRDWSVVNTLNTKFDLTSQIDRYNQVKVGFVYNYDDLNVHTAKAALYLPSDSYYMKWRYFPSRLGAYAQDKLEFEGMIANVGVRMDYNNPNADWYNVDRYSKYFGKQYRNVFTKLAPRKRAKGHLEFSPRLGVSHPISSNAKLYFNYGHFYSLPVSSDMYRIEYGNSSRGVTFLGNPSAKLPETVAYELGLDYNIANRVLLHLAGYYKDVTDQTGEVEYTNYDGSVDYRTITNDNYADIRGFEVRLDKRFGEWVTGWINYNYMVETDGYIGRQHYFQDQRLQRIEGLHNPYQERPLARPYARANIVVRSPEAWGPSFHNVKPFSSIQMSWLFTWKAGRYETWDPLRTYTLKQNLQWKGRYNFDMKLGKLVRFGKYNLNFYASIQNVFNTKYMEIQGFENGTDLINYYRSLHLPMYKGAKYKAAGFIGGNDKPGDVKSKDKPYINMPNRKFLTYLNPRSFFFGLNLDF